jgi:hypothetical protein
MHGDNLRTNVTCSVYLIGGGASDLGLLSRCLSPDESVSSSLNKSSELTPNQTPKPDLNQTPFTQTELDLYLNSEQPSNLEPSEQTNVTGI